MSDYFLPAKLQRLTCRAALSLGHGPSAGSAQFYFFCSKIMPTTTDDIPNNNGTVDSIDKSDAS